MVFVNTLLTLQFVNAVTLKILAKIVDTHLQGVILPKMKVNFIVEKPHMMLHGVEIVMNVLVVWILSAPTTRSVSL